MKRKYKNLVEVAALAGIILLESHAESYRVEDTVRRILSLSGFSNTEVISTSTGLFITLDDDSEDVEPYTIVRRVTSRGNHLNKIYRVNNISRQLTEGHMSVEQARMQLNLVNESEYSLFGKDLAVTIMVLGFTVLLGGNGFDALMGVGAGILLAFGRISQNYLEMNSFISSAFSTFLVTFLVNLGASFFPGWMNSDIIVIAALMPLFPGVAFTNGIRDTLKGDYVSGVARMTDAIVIAVSIALGVALGLATFKGVVAL